VKIQTFSSIAIHTLRPHVQLLVYFHAAISRSMYLRILFLTIALASCTHSKTFKLLQEGSVHEDKFLETIPFEMRIGVPIVTATVNGKKGNFLFDTGAPNVISVDFAEQLNLNERLKNKITDSGGHIVNDQSYISIDSIQLGGVNFLSTGGVVMDLKSSRIFRCLDIDGIIGANLMRQAAWKIDYEDETISFSSHIDTFQVDSTFMAIAFIQRMQGTPMVDMTVNGVEVKKMIFDTGSNKGLSMPLRILKEIRTSTPTLQEIYAEGSSSYGVGGKDKSDTIFYAAIDSLYIGNQLMKPEVISFDENSDTFGNEILENFQVVLDWKKQMIYLKPIAQQGSSLDTFGFNIELIEGAVRVGSIYENSSASEFLQLGDTLSRLQDYQIDEMSEDEICELLVNRTLRFNSSNQISIVVKRSSGLETFELEKRRLLPFQE